MNAHPAFEIKSFSTPMMVVDLYHRLQSCIDNRSPWQWRRTRRVRSTLTARQQRQRLQQPSATAHVQHVAVDIIPTVAATKPRVRHT